MNGQMECDSLTDQQLVALIAEDTVYLKCASQRTREYCLRFMQHISGDTAGELLQDVYHDALIALYEKARTGTFTLTCSLQTWLNSVCRNQLLNMIRRGTLTARLPTDYDNDSAGIHEQYSDTITDWLHQDETDINNDRVQAIIAGLEQMKGKGDCHELLLLVHYQGKSMKDVAAHFGYKNEQIARNKNYLCREQLKALAFRTLKKMKR